MDAEDHGLRFALGRDVDAYVSSSKNRSDRDRAISKKKTGVILAGISARNPISGRGVPWIVADYVLASYGSGAVMGVPARDERDREIAEAFAFPIVESVKGGELVNSGRFSGMAIEAARSAFAALVDAEEKVNFKMRDWVFSRQRFWGEPFPIVWIAGREDHDRVKQGAVGAWLPREPIT